jgi:hypothetical protein
MNRHSYLALLGLAVVVLMLAYLLGALAPPFVARTAGASAPAAPSTAQKVVLQQVLVLLGDVDDVDSLYLPLIDR